MPLDHLCRISRVPLHAAPSRFFDEIPRLLPLRLLREVIIVTNDDPDRAGISVSHCAPTLSTLAANVCASRITEANDFSLLTSLTRVKQFMCDSTQLPFTAQFALREALYQRWRSLSVGEHTWLAEAVAIERVLAGQSSKVVAKAHGISAYSGLMHQLSLLAVDGLAGRRAHAGECCYKVAEAHDIELDSIAFNALQKYAVRGLAGERVCNGESCLDVAEDHGICLLYEAMEMLEMVAVNSCAGERVRNGESCLRVAIEHGINPQFSAMCALESIAVNTVAGERVRQGESCRLVAREQGINCCYRAMHQLEMIAVDSLGIERVRNGECNICVAQSLGISLDGNAAKVLADLETVSVNARKRPRLM